VDRARGLITFPKPSATDQ